MIGTVAPKDFTLRLTSKALEQIPNLSSVSDKGHDIILDGERRRRERTIHDSQISITEIYSRQIPQETERALHLKSNVATPPPAMPAASCPAHADEWTSTSARGRLTGCRSATLVAHLLFASCGSSSEQTPLQPSAAAAAATSTSPTQIKLKRYGGDAVRRVPQRERVWGRSNLCFRSKVKTGRGSGERLQRRRRKEPKGERCGV